ncbi:MAG: YncE family protein [Nitrospirae bacterium]|nr:YncE family protein [Nitrospirota bacterium]
MINHKNILSFWFFVLFQIAIIIFQGCATTEQQESRPELYQCQVALFLNGPERSAADITFELAAVNIIAEDGTSREIVSVPLRINSNNVKGRQIFLGEKSLPIGKYEKLELFVKEASITKKGKALNLALPPDGVKLSIDVSLRRNQSTTLFLSWNADASVQEDYLFNPVLAVKSQVPELSSMLIYVSNEDSDNVSVINRQAGDIAATVLVGKKPRGMATSIKGEHLKVYVANSGSNSVSVIDPTTNKIENEIPIRFGRQPEAIAVAGSSSDKELIFVANYGSDTVSMIDASTYQELEKIDVGRGPIAIATDPPVETLAGTRFLSFDDINALRSYRERFFNVYVANQNSNSVSVLRIDAAAKRSVEVINLSVEWRPVALSVDYLRGKVYIANYDSDKLSVVDIPQTVRGNTSAAVSTINNIGYSTIGVIADPAFDRLYLLKERPGQVVIVRPFADGIDTFKTVMPPVMGTIAVGSSPRSFILDPEARKLYVVNRGSDSISVIDKTTMKEEQVIPVGKKPYGITIFQN